MHFGSHFQGSPYIFRWVFCFRPEVRWKNVITGREWQGKTAHITAAGREGGILSFKGCEETP